MAAALTALLALSWQPLPPPCTLARPHSTPLRAAALRMESDGSRWDLRQQVKARQRKLRIELRWSLRRVERTVTSISSSVEIEVARRRQGSMLQSLFEREQVSLTLSGDGEVTRDDEARASLSPSPSTAGAPTDASNLRLPGRRLAIVSTAALPWQTGTSVNPLLRAAHLATKGFPVCLVLPWLSLEQQPILFPAGLTFSASHEQEAWLRAYLQRAGFAEAPLSQNLSFRWYAAEYVDRLGSLLQRCGVDVPPEERDVAILEEPEHLNWFHHGQRWRDAYRHVVGVLHTNYGYYAMYEEREGGVGDVPGEKRAEVIADLNALVCRGHLDVAIKLSATLPDVPGTCVVCNVHGVRPDFLAVGSAAAALPEAQREASFDKGAYFLGKAIWTKGYRALFDELSDAMAREGGGGGGGAAGAGAGAAEMMPTVHTYGSGRDAQEIRDAVSAGGLPVVVHAGTDHAGEALHGYRVFVNPSTSEVLCTATAEALAMGKRVLIPRHPSNAFFEQFGNAVLYEERAQLVPLLRDALATPPAPLTPKELYLLSWEAGTERLLDAALLPASRAPLSAEPLLSALAYRFHWLISSQPFADAWYEFAGATPQHAAWRDRLAAAVGGADAPSPSVP